MPEKFTFKSKNKIEKLFNSYIIEKKNLSSLSKENNICEKTLRNHIKSIKIAKPQKLNLKEVILLVDTTYWGRNFGVVVFEDTISNKFIWWRFVNPKEKLEGYGFKWCREQGYIIKAVVSDGFKGLAKIITPTPFQICEVHIQRAVMTKLTRKPKSDAGMELLALSKELCNLSSDDFIEELKKWQEKHKDFLNEKP